MQSHDVQFLHTAFIRYSLTHVPAVLAALNSATFAENAGRPVAATSGMKPILWLERNRSWRVTSLELQCPPRNRWYRCSRRRKISENATIAHMRAGRWFVGPISANSVITTFHGTFSSVGIARSGLAIDARATGCEKTGRTFKQWDRHGDGMNENH